MMAAVKTPLELYKFLLRQCAKLPSEPAQFYRFQIRQGYNSHADESDPERVQQIVQQVAKDSEWIVQKYARVPERDPSKKNSVHA